MSNKVDMYEIFADMNDTSHLDAGDMDLSSIKSRVFQTIGQQPEISKESKSKPSLRFRRAIIIAVAACLILASLGAYAATTGTLFGVTLFADVEQEQLLDQYAVITGSRIEGMERDAYGYSADILDEDYFNDDNEFIFNSAGTIEAQKATQGYQVPDFVFDNGDMAIITKGKSDGWKLERGESVRLSFRQNVEDNPNASKDGDILEVGIIVDGKPMPLQTIDGIETEFQYTASERGTYYFYIQNYSADVVIVADASIE